MLGYCKSFSSSLIGFWSSGTGFAGIFGSGFFLVLRALKFTDFWVLYNIILDIYDSYSIFINISIQFFMVR